MSYLFKILTVILCILYSNASYALNSNWSGIEEAKVRIISPFTSNSGNSEIYLGLEYQLKEGWKTYWHSPGDGGFPQTLTWEGSNNISSLKILWPQPKQFDILGLKSIGYENKVIFPIFIKLEDINKNSFFAFDINYLTCKDICIPGNAHVELILPAGIGKTTKYFYEIEKALSKIPIKEKKISGYNIFNVSIGGDKNNSLITFEAQSDHSFNNPIFFLGNDQGMPIVDPKYKFSANRKNVKIKFYYENYILDKKSYDLSILLIDKNIAYEYLTSLEAEKIKSSFSFKNSFFYILIISYLGGLILNLMPCVLPVLSLKLMSILKNKEQNSLPLIRQSFFTTAVGIIASFLLLSIILILIRFSGASIGWGMQFQQPIFLMILSLVLFLFALNLIGLFEFKLPYILNNLSLFFIKRRSFYADFFNGFFATLLATPCSAPFVGTAISAAFTQTPLMMTCIFLFMGIGMSTPYIIASIFPSSIILLPKPGSWMNILRLILSILLISTIVWIEFILLNHFNFYFVIINIIIFITILIIFKFLKKLKFFFITGSIIIYFSLLLVPQLNSEKIIKDNTWINFQVANIDELIKENIVFVDITADWCATCQFNKINVLNSDIIENLFIEKKIIKVRGDWTKPNKDIEKYLNSYNKYGIPFNILYNKDNPNGIIFSELLTTTEIIDAINNKN